MKYSQNLRIEQVTEKTLVIGVDIAKNVHYARTFNWRGIEVSKVLKFKADSEGFGEFIGWVKKVAEKLQMNKYEVGFEPTGHYWFTFAQAIKRERMIVQVNPYHVKRSKELDDGTPSKSDRKDPKTIAMLVINGRYQTPYIPEGIYAELRQTNNMREDYVKKVSVVKNKVQRWLDIYFPEFPRAFSNWTGKAALLTLERVALPYKIAVMAKEEIVAMWRQEVQRGVGVKKA